MTYSLPSISSPSRPKVTKLNFSPPTSIQSLSNLDAITPLWKYRPKEPSFGSLGAISARTERKTRTVKFEVLKTDRTERPERQERPEKVEKTEKTERLEPIEKEVRFERPKKTDVTTILMQEKVRDQVELFLSSGEYVILTAAWRATTAEDEDEARKKLGKSDFLFKTFETVLGLCQLNYKIFDALLQDSAMSIEPISSENLLFKQCTAIILMQLAKFPFTFFNKLKLRLFSFCKTVSLDNSVHKDVYYKRVVEGLFEIDNCTNPAAIRLHFYKLLCYHIARKSKPEVFASTWKRFNQPGFAYLKEPKIRYHGHGLKGFLNEECTKSLQTDQAIFLERLVTDHASLLSHPDDIIRRKAQFMMETLMDLDSNFALLKGWEI